MISKNLENCSFVKVSSKGKNPVERDWVNKPHTYVEANEFLDKGHNVGLLCGYNNIVGIDCDSKYFEEILKKYLPTDTYTQLSANRGLPHYIYYCKGWDIYRTIDNPNRKEVHYGEIMNKGRQIILAPSSINGKQYKIVNDLPPKEVKPEQILALIQHFEGDKIVERVKEEKGYTQHTDIDDINILDVVPLSGLKKASNGEYFGSNPWHGSTTGMNFWVSPSKNVGYCFRCDAGIQPIKAVALNMGVIKSCDELLRGDKFKETLEIAKNSGLIKREEEVKKVSDIIEQNKKDQKQVEENDYLKVRTYKDFEKIKKPTDYLIEDFLPISSLTMIYSAPGSFKTIISQQMALCIATGKDFLGLKTKKHTILFSDKENNDFIIKDRLSRLKKGNKINRKNFPIYYLTRKDGDLDSSMFLDKLMKTIDKYKISMLVLDTLNRHSNYEENSATDLSRLYTNVFMPLIEQHGVSIVFLHHTNKTGGYRGSGDFLGMCDIVYRVERRGKADNFTLVNEKNRMGEIDEIGANIHFDEDNIRFEKRDTIEDDKEEKNKFIALVEKIKEILKKEGLSRKEIEEILQADEYDFSLSTLKNCLRWMVRKEILIQPKRGKYELVQQPITDGEFVGTETNSIQEIVMDLFTQSTIIQEQYLINLLEKKGYSNKESEEELKKGKTTGLWYEITPGRIKKI